MEQDKEIPSVLIMSSSEKQPLDIIKLIVGDDHQLNRISLEDGVEGYLWKINTKYYETNVNLCAVANKGLVTQNLASGVQAVIIYFDSNKAEGLKTVDSWLPFIKEYRADICILLCTRCEENPVIGVSKLKAQEWCVKEGFELVELEPEVDEEWETEQDFVETTGIKRVVQALHAHVWPNLTLKERSEPTTFNNLLHGDSLNQEMADLTINDLCSDMMDGNIEDRIEELIQSGSQGDFTNLFSQLRTLKERVSTLPNDQRKVCAEQVVLAFWKAIGGDDEEVILTEEDIF
uniref:Alpha-and gamma-adaptin-binding protein p34 n=1 Tax=Clastoptera arizonana TaxID=38151 RepID=A0A1B6CQ08_9HEMI